ncbi:hypothetical protein L5515_000636 [Caenorhabditis briggsae]|uniref:E3 ubiquitin-protein ligase listerin n=1 Tax=Caenorhabditis briggsae TaxID=6238 RepID=A0AAE9DYY1_CAEBR|nr:hypothetical protein L5515_000636 [Caenorhabditis briggsae]
MSKQQRRKGNAKNASSASAHGYLTQGGENFVGLTPEMNIFEMASSNRLSNFSGIDDETRIVMRKLTKKDCQTREKGLRELTNIINAETSSIENCYEHFCGLVPQLSTDGSPTVRLLTMKTITLFLVKLKKSACKGLKKIIPMVLFARCDVTNGVAAAAGAVIRDGFEADKKQKVIQLFAPLVFEMAAKIVQGKHDLSVPVEYDASEDPEARKSRLETQSLNVFLSYIKEFGADSTIWEEEARKLFENIAFLKMVFGGTNAALKVQVLNLAYRFKNNVEVILNTPSIVTYIQNHLDSQTFTPECSTAWEGMIILLPSAQFHTKVSLQNGIYPRFLNVIRKKGNHWRVLQHFLLPAVVLLLKEMGSLENDMKVLGTIMESFTDNLPWPTDASINAVLSWFNAFSDFVRWILTNDRINLVVWEKLHPLIVTVTEQAMTFPTKEIAECVTDLLQWIIELKTINEADVSTLLLNIESKIVGAGTENSRLIKHLLTEPGKNIVLSNLHANLLSSPELVDFQIIKNLSCSENDYFNATSQKISNFSFIEKTENFDITQAGDIVRLIKLLLENQEIKSLNISVKNDHVGRRLLLTGGSTIWNKLLKNVPVSTFQNMINYWHEKRNGTAIADAVSFLKEMGVEMDTKQAAENVEFLITLLRKMKSTDVSNEAEKNVLILKLFTAIFESDEDAKSEHYNCLSEHLTSDFNSGQFFEKLFASSEEYDIERILETACRVDKLIDLCEEQTRQNIVNNVLLSGKQCGTIIEQFQFLELEVMSCSTKPTVISTTHQHCYSHLDEHKAKEIVTESARIALFNISSKYYNSAHQVFGWQVISIISALEKRYSLVALTEELQRSRREIEERLIRSDEVRFKLDDSSPCMFLADAYDMSFEQKKKYIQCQAEPSKVPEHALEVLYRENQTPLDFLMNVFEGGYQMFDFDRSKNYHWMINLMFVKKCIQYGGSIFVAEESGLRDYALCGIVTVLDQSTDILGNTPNAFDEDPRLEALTTLFIELYLVLNDSIKNDNHPTQTIEEWKEFYVPTINSLFIRMFRMIRKEQQPTPFVRTLLKAMFTLVEFPTNVPNDSVVTREFVPELSVFKYSLLEESFIAQAFILLSSNVEHVQLIGYAAAKLLVPIMFKTENPQVLDDDQDETEIMVANRSKLNLPVMISKSYPVDHIHKHVGPLLLSLAILPLETTKEFVLNQEQRVAYCDAIDSFFKNALNALMLDQPFDFSQVPIVCKIPKSQEREYYLQSDLTASPLFFEKFASRLLFKSITLLPAAVRLFHKNIPNNFKPIFQEVVTKHASKLLIENELNKVQNAEFGEVLKVRTVPVTGQIISEYTVEDTKMKLTIELPRDYPLSVPAMNLDKAIVKGDRAKKWLLQLNAYLFHQNGAILEGIEMWKRNVDKGIEGAEDCTICMMTVHQQTNQLPKVKCKQCKNRFHSNCLYKWFESSNQSTCPLCRNNFT